MSTKRCETTEIAKLNVHSIWLVYVIVVFSETMRHKSSLANEPVQYRAVISLK